MVSLKSYRMKQTIIDIFLSGIETFKRENRFEMKDFSTKRFIIRMNMQLFQVVEGEMKIEILCRKCVGIIELNMLSAVG